MAIETEEEFEKRKNIYKKISVTDLKGLPPIDSQERKDTLWEKFVIRPLVRLTLGNDHIHNKLDTLRDNDDEKNEWFDDVLETQKNNREQKGRTK